MCCEHAAIRPFMVESWEEAVSARLPGWWCGPEQPRRVLKALGNFGVTRARVRANKVSDPET